MIRGLSSRSFYPGDPDTGRGIDLYLLLSAGLLLFIGLASLYSIDYSQGDTNWFSKQLLLAIVGIAPLLLMWKVPSVFWRRFSLPIYIFNALLLLAVLSVGVSASGAQRWIDVGPIQFQPSELTKIALALTLAAFYTNRAENIKKLSTFLLSIAHVALPMLLVFRQPHLGGTLILLGIWIAVTVVSGVPWKFIGTAVLAVALLGVVAWNVPGALTQEQKSRVSGFLDPDPGDGYQQERALVALGSGGAFGTGYLKGDMKAKGAVPEQQTDFVFSVVGEEGGLFGATLVLSAFGFFFFRCWLAAFKTGDPFKRMVGAGLLAALGLHFVANIGMNLTMLPVVGLWLPFMSYGGTALWLCMASLGFFAGCK